MNRCLTSLVIFIGLGVTTAKADSTSFAIVSPTETAKFKTLSGSKEAQTVVSAAENDLKREPTPMARVHTEGTLPHQGIFDESIRAENDWSVMLRLGLAYQITHDPRYLQAEEKFLNAWMDVYKISFNPIDETSMTRIILAYDLTRADLTIETRAKVDSFLQTMSQGYLAQIQNKKDPGNWQSHRIKLATLAAFALGDEKLIAETKAAFDHHLAENILPDGSTYDFHLRDALHYTVYDLEPLTECAIAAKMHGEDWFHGNAPGDVSVAAGLDWLTPYAEGERTHEEFVHSPVKFDAQRAQAGIKGYSGTWDPLTSIALFQLATMIDPKYQAVVTQLTQKGAHPQDWSTLLLQAGI